MLVVPLLMATQLAAPGDPSAIVGGDATSGFAGAVAVSIDERLCSGALVSPTVVLTAAHCLDPVTNVERIRVYTGSSVEGDGVAGTKFGIHPRYCADCDEDRFDYGYVILNSAIADATVVEPIATQAEWDDAMFVGNAVTVVGFGASDSGEMGRKRETTTEIMDLSSTGWEFQAGGGGQDSCDGDSGGPAYVELADGTLRLAGITSRGSMPCGNGGFYGAPYPALCWLSEKTDADLRRDGCGSCNCIDTRVESGCRVAQPRSPSLTALLLLLLLVRRKSAARTGCIR